MKTRTINILRWSLFIAGITFIIFAILFREIGSISYQIQTVFLYSALCFLIVLSILLLIKRDTIPLRFKQVQWIMVILTALLYLINEYLLKTPTKALEDITTLILTVNVIIGLICLIQNIERLVPLFILFIILGIVFYRLGATYEGMLLVVYSEVALTITLFLSAIRSFWWFKGNTFLKLFFSSYCILFMVANLLFIKNLANPEENIGLIESIGALIVLLACVAIFIIMPFSNYLEWVEKAKTLFKRLILTPLIFLFVLYSMKFIMPADTHRSIFLMDDVEKTRHGMFDYEFDDESWK